jgi:hypothetical protein
MFIYGMTNLAYTKITGTSVYPVITWDNAYADILAPVMIPFFMLLWLAIFYLSKCKFKKLEMDKPELYLLLDSGLDEIPNFQNKNDNSEDNIGLMNNTASVSESASPG